MKRKPARPALAAVAVLVSFYTGAEMTLTAQAYQQTDGGYIQEASGNLNKEWKDDGRRYQVTTKTDPLNMRADAGQAYAIITTIPKGAVVTVMQTCDGWGKVQYGSIVGYCAMEWLTLVPDTVAEPDSPTVPVTVVTPKLDPEANEQAIYAYLTGTLGLPRSAACGIIGNIHVETGGTFNPEAHNPLDTGGTQSYGLCQWNSGAAAGNRLNELQTYTAQWNTLEGQLDFIRHDLLENTYLRNLHLYDDLKALGDTEEDAVTAANRWASSYEGCAKYTYEARRTQARLYWVKHGGKSTQWQAVNRIYIVATQSDGLNLRSAPSTSVGILLTLPKDTAVTVKSISEDGKWANVEYNGVTGYCVTEYLREKTSAALTASGVMSGDLNGNREVGVDDAQITLKAYAERISGNDMGLTAAQIKAADINGDGQVSVEDAQMILKYYTAKYVSGKNITWEQLIR